MSYANGGNSLRQPIQFLSGGFFNLSAQSSSTAQNVFQNASRFWNLSNTATYTPNSAEYGNMVYNSLNSRNFQEPVAPTPLDRPSNLAYPTIRASRAFGNRMATQISTPQQAPLFESSIVPLHETEPGSEYSPLEQGLEATDLPIVEQAGTSLAESLVTDPVANLAGFAAGQGISHLPDLQASNATQQAANTYNSAQRVDQDRAQTTISATQSDAQLGATIGSIVPVVGSAIGAGIGAAIGTTEQTQGSDLSSSEETAQL